MSDSKSHREQKKFSLDQLEKKHIYQVPDKYFDNLPGMIQSRVTAKKPFFKTNSFRLGIRYAFPVACLLVIGIYFGFFGNQNKPSQSVESLIAEVSYDDLVAYLKDSEISTDDIIASIEDQNLLIDFDRKEVDPFQDFDLEGENIDELMDELDISEDIF